ncbi:MAG: hypothetical protein PWP11_522 [Thauera sp.]|nr:hypothetical protein [Thauera sp.]
MPIPYLVTGSPEQFIVSTADKVIGRELFLYGEFDFAKLQVAVSILTREGLPAPSHLIDVGANIGTITIPALKRGLMQTATAIEPHPDNLRLLRANLALNGLENRVAVLAQAVSDLADVTLFLHESLTNSGNHTISTDGIPVPSSRLDDMNFPPNSLLWMDIEGHEGHALKGAERLLATGIPVVCEFNPEFLIQSGGMNAFRRAFEGRRIYDLQVPGQSKINLEAIANKLRLRPNNLQWTDILALS